MIRRALGLLVLSLGVCHAAPLIDFPTDNHALSAGHPEDFFMYVDRNFEGELSKPWQGGQFGYVRGPVREDGKVVYLQLHEGIDIKPLRRDAQGNPLDDVKAAAAGKVVHTSPDAGASNYGRYVVIEHIWDGCPYYTLYAHLAAIAVTPGQLVQQGQPIGRLGFTGAGINQERAHVHLEVCLLMSRNFEAWHNANFPRDPNRHGLYNGLNLVGADPARLLLEAQRNPNLRIRDYLSTLEPAFKIAVKNSPNFDLIRRYPWLVPDGQPANPPAWSITFSRHGVPIKVEALSTPIAAPQALWVKDSGESVGRLTKKLIAGTPAAPRLTDSGLRFAQLLTWPD